MPSGSAKRKKRKAAEREALANDLRMTSGTPKLREDQIEAFIKVSSYDDLAARFRKGYHCYLRVTTWEGVTFYPIYLEKDHLPLEIQYRLKELELPTGGVVGYLE